MYESKQNRLRLARQVLQLVSILRSNFIEGASRLDGLDMMPE